VHVCACIRWRHTLTFMYICVYVCVCVYMCVQTCVCNICPTALIRSDTVIDTSTNFKARRHHAHHHSPWIRRFRIVFNEKLEAMFAVREGLYWFDSMPAPIFGFVCGGFGVEVRLEVEEPSLACWIPRDGCIIHIHTYRYTHAYTHTHTHTHTKPTAHKKINLKFQWKWKTEPIQYIRDIMRDFCMHTLTHLRTYHTHIRTKHTNTHTLTQTHTLTRTYTHTHTHTHNTHTHTHTHTHLPATLATLAIGAMNGTGFWATNAGGAREISVICLFITHTHTQKWIWRI